MSTFLRAVYRQQEVKTKLSLTVRASTSPNKVCENAIAEFEKLIWVLPGGLQDQVEQGCPIWGMQDEAVTHMRHGLLQMGSAGLAAMNPETRMRCRLSGYWADEIYSQVVLPCPCLPPETMLFWRPGGIRVLGPRSLDDASADRKLQVRIEVDPKHVLCIHNTG